MIFRQNTSFKQMLAEDVEEKEGFTTTANASDNLYHPIAFCRDEFFQVCFTFKIHNSMTFFCVKTRFSVANIRFLHNFTKFYRNLHGIFKVFNKERAEKQLLTVNSVNPSCFSALKLYSASSFSAIALPRASHCAFTSRVIACFISTGSPTAS